MGLVARDTGGVLVGTVIDPDVPLQVVRPHGGRYMVFPRGVDGFLTTCPLLCYESANCTGTPYRDALDALLPFVAVCATTGYYPTGAATSRAISSCAVVGDPQCIPRTAVPSRSPPWPHSTSALSVSRLRSTSTDPKAFALQRPGGPEAQGRRILRVCQPASCVAADRRRHQACFLSPRPAELAYSADPPQEEYA